MRVTFFTLTSILVLICYDYFFYLQNWLKKNQIYTPKMQEIKANENNKIYSINLPEGLDTVEFKAKIKIDRTKKIHKIKLAKSSGETTVMIYSNFFKIALQNKSVKKLKPLIAASFHNQQEILINVTSLPFGKYYVHYLSCNNGGVFQLIIE